MSKILNLILLSICLSSITTQSITNKWITTWQNDNSSCCIPNSLILTNSSNPDFLTAFYDFGSSISSNCQAIGIVGSLSTNLTLSSGSVWWVDATLPYQFNVYYDTLIFIQNYSCEFSLLPSYPAPINQDTYMDQMTGNWSTISSSIGPICMPSSFMVGPVPNSPNLSVTFNFNQEANSNACCRTLNITEGIYVTTDSMVNLILDNVTRWYEPTYQYAFQYDIDGYQLIVTCCNDEGTIWLVNSTNNTNRNVLTSVLLLWSMIYFFLV